MNDALEAGTFVIDSHRGAFKGGLLENSIPAFEEAVHEGANMLECDVRGTRDGCIVLVHNKTIDHVASHATRIPDLAEFNEAPAGKVNDHTVAFLKALQFDHGAGIITLDEFLSFLGRHRVGAQVELKEFHFNRAIVQALVDAALDHGSLRAPVVFTSFNAMAVMALRKALLKAGVPVLDPARGTTGPGLGLQAIPLGSFIGKPVLRWCKARQVWGFTTYYKYLPASRIACAHACNVKFVPRVPDDPALVRSYIDANVDGFETDNVPFIKACIADAGYTYNS